jgi:hypothetical protein
MPAHGFFVRHVKGIEMRDVEIRCLEQDSRPAFVLEDVEDADFTRIKAARGSAGTWKLTNVRDFGVSQSRPLLDTYFENVTESLL